MKRTDQFIRCSLNRNLQKQILNRKKSFILKSYEEQSLVEVTLWTISLQNAWIDHNLCCRFDYEEGKSSSPLMNCGARLYPWSVPVESRLSSGSVPCYSAAWSIYVSVSGWRLDNFYTYVHTSPTYFVSYIYQNVQVPDINFLLSHRLPSYVQWTSVQKIPSLKHLFKIYLTWLF
jgi:hypothetical protein